jgi:RNA polymerase sigma-70 factor (ECF subfamily)
VEPSPDRALVALLREGDPVAFDQAYARHAAKTFNFLARMTSQRQRAEDLYQEVWLKLAVHAPRLSEDTDLGAWLYTVARNLARSERRADKVRPRSVDLPLDAAHAEPSPYEWAAASETEARLERALADLAPPFREVLLLVVVEGIEHERAAQILELAPDALRQRLSRARAKLAERFEELAKRPRPATMTEDEDGRPAP